MYTPVANNKSCPQNRLSQPKNPGYATESQTSGAAHENRTVCCFGFRRWYGQKIVVRRTQRT